MSNLQTFSFAITQADIAPYNGGAAVSTWTNIPTPAEGTAEYTVQKVEVADGEGKLVQVWFHTQRCKVTLRIKKFAFHIFEMLSGSPVSSAQGTDKMYFGRDEEINPPVVRLRLQQKAIDQNGNTGYFETIIFQARGMLPPITMREVTASDYTCTFDGLESTVDEAGATIPSAMLSVRALKTSLA